jgi:hypothetical protein
MTRQQLEQKLAGVEAQMRWASFHGADQELLDLLRVESERLFVKIGQYPRSQHQFREKSLNRLGASAV